MGAVVVLTAAIPVLAYVGFHKVFTTTQGRKVDAQNDPTVSIGGGGVTVSASLVSANNSIILAWPTNATGFVVRSTGSEAAVRMTSCHFEIGHAAATALSATA